MNTCPALRRGLLALSCAAWLFTSTTQAQPVSTPPSSGAGSGGISIGDLLGTPPASGGGTSNGGGVSAGGGGAMCNAPLGGATCGGAGPASQGNTSGVNTGAGNPINLTNGNKFQTEVDLPALPGELGLEIVRHYNSTHRYVLGQLGVGWRLSYETDLYVIGRTVQILQADGARLVFNIDPSNPSLCASADPAQGWVQILTRPSGKKEYLWHWTHGEHAGRRLRFDERGKLVQVIAASGAVLSIDHSPRGQLLRVTDPQGRTLMFNHGGLARVRQAEAAQQQQREQQRQASGADPLVGTLHDESRQPLVELDAQGRITRQYVWLADMPLAVIDTPASLALTEPGIEQVFKDIATALQSWFDDFEGIAWLHTNHLGAPEAATNAQGHVIWRARYSPFGAATVLPPLPAGERAGVRGEPAPAFTLPLRLPGQVWDEETGLHHNRQRYYHPEHGQYLTPDPLGTPDGPNPYAYVAFNPLSNIDPDGLILFAFDGTGNDESNPNELSNVVRLRNLYASDEGLAFTSQVRARETPEVA
jgi:RHS repeat-associated protein